MLVLALRVLLRFFNAGQAPFVRWVYETSEPLINPFRGMFPNPVLTSGNVLEINTLIALLVYAFIGYLIGELLSFITYNTSHYHTIEEVGDRPRRRR